MRLSIEREDRATWMSDPIRKLEPHSVRDADEGMAPPRERVPSDGKIGRPAARLEDDESRTQRRARAVAVRSGVQVE